MLAPDFGLCPTGAEPTVTWPHTWAKWPDFGLPLHSGDAREAIRDLWLRCANERVEVACGGGRTGTVLAALAMLDELERDAAITWVRQGYDRRAVDAPWQRRRLTD